jgi:predicted nicotinamide N-methyase
MAQANALLVVPEDRSRVEAGERLNVLPLSRKRNSPRRSRCEAFGRDDAPALLAGFDVVTSQVDVHGEEFSIVHPRDAESLIDEAAFNRDERLPYWADLWPSAIALARAVRALAGEGRTLLELGCGVGLVAAAALKAGFDVTASDYYDEALAFARLNGARNALREPKTMVLDWRHLPTAIPAYDIVVGADVLYERAYGSVVARAIATTLTERGRARSPIQGGWDRRCSSIRFTTWDCGTSGPRW